MVGQQAPLETHLQNARARRPQCHPQPDFVSLFRYESSRRRRNGRPATPEWLLGRRVKIANPYGRIPRRIASRRASQQGGRLQSRAAVDDGTESANHQTRAHNFSTSATLTSNGDGNYHASKRRQTAIVHAAPVTAIFLKRRGSEFTDVFSF
jgi:hypothetical protein